MPSLCPILVFHRVALLTLVLAEPVLAAQIGTIPPAESLTASRIAALPAADRAPWAAYLARSEAQWAADREALAAERQGLSTLPPARAGGHSEGSMPLDKPANWYASEGALVVARNILSFQTPAGGWGKNQPRNAPPRERGQAYVAENNLKKPSPNDYDLPQDSQWSYVGTVDNDATITEIRFLARVAKQFPGAAGEPYRQAAQRGVVYLLAAQFPNGGWPQVWPLQGGYHDAVTLNDNALVEVAELMGMVSRGEAELGFMPANMKTAAAAAQARSVQLLLAAQIRINGKLTMWAQQHDPLTLAPSSARNYEPPALCSGESANALRFLMSLPNPSPAIIEAVKGGVAMLKSLAVRDVGFVKVDDARRLVAQPGAGPLWARYYDPVTLRPVFGDRDKSLHDDVNDLSAERRNGYSWWGTWPMKTVADYDAWAARWVKPAS
ncbi:pectate lyase [Pelomonas cellulosilytica]|uniref:Pectate lyase n=1 Tax=Pelomonas cellulosilytica TaxID=2906762 RepID=A0ABS8XJK8_9BURK|nr:pectate lyase [Pelomonas sp. P8]MCE4553044.1 pectate lyase [Pelomonas sp. P8]